MTHSVCLWPPVELPAGCGDLLSGGARRQLEQELLPAFLQGQRWYGAGGDTCGPLRLPVRLHLERGGKEWLLLIAEAPGKAGEPACYFVPLAVALGSDGERLARESAPRVIARVRSRGVPGVLYDALADGSFASQLVEIMGGSLRMAFPHGGVLLGTATRSFPDYLPDGPYRVRDPGLDQTNTGLVVAERAFLKVYRRLNPGPHPEWEMGRFLAGNAGCPHVPPVLGAVEIQGAGFPPVVLCLAQGFVQSAEDGWTFTLKHLLGEVDADPSRLREQAHPPSEALDSCNTRMARLGRRTAALHRALAVPTDNEAFVPEPIQPTDLAQLRAQVWALLEAAMTDLMALHGELSGAERQLLDQLLAARAPLERWIDELMPARVDAVKTRLHGDYHLGQVLVTADDFCIIDFEGEPVRPLSQRRAKQSPLKDVAGMMRSFNYAAWSARIHGTGKTAIDHDLPEALAGWERRTARAFLGGYRRGIQGCPVWPTDAPAAERLLTLFVLEKALYEIIYEARHRPRWLPIPVRGVLALLSGGVLAVPPGGLKPTGG